MRLVTLLTLLAAIVSFPIRAQLPGQDERFLLELTSKLSLSEDQALHILALYEGVQVRLDSLDTEIAKLQQYGEDEASISRLVPILSQKKKDEREMRELKLKSLLAPSQLLVYEGQIKPTKPAVLHFGIHDRMYCNVCVK